MESPPGPETVINGRRYHYFAGTSYLGLHGHPEVIAAGCAAFRRLGLHTATSRPGFGHCAPVLEVERRAAAFWGKEAAFYVASGYVTNHLLIQAAGPVAGVWVDESAHFCVWEATRLAGAPVHTFQPRDVDDLRAQLQRHLPPGGRPLVMADAIMPATGAVFPVADALRVLREFAPAVLILDDAHGAGVLGTHGRGTLEHFGYWEAANGGQGVDGVELWSGATLAKALGGFGGIIVGSEPFVERVRQSSHYYDGASAPPAPVAAASAKALDIVAADPSLRARLHENRACLQAGLRGLGLRVPETPAAQVGVVAGPGEIHQRLQAALQEEGFIVPAIRAYAGLGSEGVLRFAACAGHTVAQIEALLAALARHLPL